MREVGRTQSRSVALILSLEAFAPARRAPARILALGSRAGRPPDVELARWAPLDSRGGRVRWCGVALIRMSRWRKRGRSQG